MKLSATITNLMAEGMKLPISNVTNDATFNGNKQ